MGSTPEYGPERWVFAVVIIASTIVFGVVFFLSWLLSRIHWPKIFPHLETYDKADWCSRVGSTLHSCIVVPGFIITMSLTDWKDYWPVDEGQAAVSATRVLMSISMGYFAFDFFVIVFYRVPLWYVFVVHHIVSCTPFYIHLFMLTCRSATFVLEGFLLVEVVNVFMNAMTWLDRAGAVKSFKYTVVFYINYILWIPARLAIPIYMLVVMYEYTYFDARMDEHRACLVPGMICGHTIAVFCWAVFIVFLSPDMVRRWKNPEKERAREDSIEQQRREQGIGSSRSEPTATATAEEEGEGTSVSASPPSRASSPVSTPKNISQFVATTLHEMAVPHHEDDRSSSSRGERTLDRTSSLYTL